MRKIFKYKIEVKNEQVIECDGSIHPLCVQLRHNEIFLWADVCIDDKTRPSRLFIHIFGTGNEIPERCMAYLGTVQKDGYVWHIYY